jgi:hypothetical protein
LGSNIQMNFSNTTSYGFDTDNVYECYLSWNAVYIFNKD